ACVSIVCRLGEVADLPGVPPVLGGGLTHRGSFLTGLVSAVAVPGAGNGMSAMRVLRFASAARAGSVSRPSSLWRPTNCAWMFGRRPGAPCSDTANTSVPWEESLQDTTRLYSRPETLFQPQRSMPSRS